MKFIIRKVGSNWFLATGKGTRYEWVAAAKATRFDDVGSAAHRAEFIGFSASEIMVEAVPK